MSDPYTIIWIPPVNRWNKPTYYPSTVFVSDRGFFFFSEWSNLCRYCARKYVCPFPPVDIQKLQCNDATNYVAMIPISWMFLDFLGGGNSNIFYFHPEPWGRFPIWRAYFSNGLVQPPTSSFLRFSNLKYQVTLSRARKRYTLSVIWQVSTTSNNPWRRLKLPFFLHRHIVWHSCQNCCYICQKLAIWKNIQIHIGSTKKRPNSMASKKLFGKAPSFGAALPNWQSGADLHSDDNWRILDGNHSWKCCSQQEKPWTSLIHYSALTWQNREYTENSSEF